MPTLAPVAKTNTPTVAVPTYGTTQYNPKTGAAVGVNKFDPNTGLSSAPKVSTTTISNSNKIDQVSKNVGDLNNYSQKGVQTDAVGTPRYADGSFVPEQTTEADTSDEDSSINTLLDNMKASTDATAANQISNIQAQFGIRKQQQQDSNMRQEKKVQNALLMGGATGQGSSAQYAPISSEGIISAQESYGVQQLAQLDTQENSLIAEAKAAQDAGNYKVMEDKLSLVKEKRAEKVSAATKLNDQIAERNQKAQDEYLQSAKDEAITDAYSQGITDVPSIIKELRSQGIQATSADVSAALKNSGVEDINKIAEQAAQNGAPLSILAKIGQAQNVNDAIIAAGEYSRDPLDAAYKKAQIAKIYNDINEAAAGGALGGMDPQNAIAYAQQYASTGTIPTGLPKGTFGVIAQVAKELPKSPGTLVDKNTGIKPSALTATQIDGVSALYDLTKKLDELESLRTDSTVDKRVGSTGRVEYSTLRDEIVDLLARARTGAAISANEEALYKSKLPNPYGLVPKIGNVKIQGLKSSLEGKLDTTLNSNGVSIYGYSQVDTPIGKKTVGETIMGENGLSGRVNPDGTVTLLNQ